MFSKLIFLFLLFIFPLSVFGQSNNDSSGGIGCCIGIIAVIVIALGISAYNDNLKKKALNEAHRAYQQSLFKLKKNPTNPNLRQTTLSLGRDYSNLTRDKKGVTIYDEMALMNDINAACAGANVVHQQPVTLAQNTHKESIEARLAKLDDLRRKQLIDATEYSQRRQAILDEI